MVKRSITRKEQQEGWDKEHKTPKVLPQMDSSKGSSGVKKFLDWLKVQGKNPADLKGLEICCGKGRNVIFMVENGVEMIGIDFSLNAIKEANKRAKLTKLQDRVRFGVHDATLPYKITPNSLDFVFDCFGSTDIESYEGRQSALNNIINVLKPGGYLMVYLLSSDDEFQKEMIKKSPGPDPGSFIHPVNGKYEKAFTETEIKDFYKDLRLCVLERIAKTDTFFGKQYKANHIWAVFQKV